MANPFSGMNNAPMPGPFGNMQQAVQSFKQFVSRFPQGFNAKQEVMNMVNSGRISQEQLNMAQQFANQYQGLFK